MWPGRGRRPEHNAFPFVDELVVEQHEFALMRGAPKTLDDTIASACAPGPRTQRELDKWAGHGHHGGTSTDRRCG